MYLCSIGLLVENETLRAELAVAMAENACRLNIDLRETRTMDMAIKKVERRKPDVVFVEMTDPFNPGAVIAKLKSLGVPSFIVAIHPAPSVELVMTAMRAGADDLSEAAPVAHQEIVDVVLDRRVVESRQQRLHAPQQVHRQFSLRMSAAMGATPSRVRMA